MSRPFRFGVQSFNAESGGDWAAQARKAESLGYSAFHLADHIIGEGAALKRSNHPLQNLAAMPAIAYAAAVTDNIRIGCRVFCVDYHDPVVLAKEAMTIDLLSGGRLELGLGAGWLAEEYKAVGLAMDPAGRRIDRLADVIAGIRAFAAGGQLDIENDTLSWHGFAGAPRPVQQPCPPIMVGGGARRILGLAGREADIVSLNFNNRSGVIGRDGVQLSTAEETVRKLDWVKAGAGARMADIELEIGAYFTFVTDKPGPMLAGMAQTFGLTEEAMRAHPHALFGPPREIIDELQRRRETYGISYITVSGQNMEAFAPVVAELSGR